LPFPFFPLIFDKIAAMRYTPLKLATMCIGGSILWLTVLYLLNRLLSMPIWFSYGLFAILTAAPLFYFFQRYQFALQYFRVFDTHPIPMWIYEYGTLRFLAVNQAAIEKYGYSRKEFLSRTIKDIRDPKEVDKLLENVRLRCNGKRYRGMWKHRKKDGTDFFVELYGHDGIYQGKRCRIIMAVDIDEQVKESLEARELAQRYDLLVKATNDAIFDWDAQQDNVVWNHGLYSIFGYAPKADATTMSWWQEKLHPEDKQRIQETLQQKLQGPDNYFEAQYRLACADGCYKTVLGRAYIIRENEQPVRMVGLIQDIDHIVEKKQIIQRLQEQNKGLREIARINSHEVRKPVVSILGITQLFDKSHQDTSLNNQLIDWLHTSTSELVEIIHKLEEKVREIEKN
jgi:PAS domain S-box-containing protein